MVNLKDKDTINWNFLQIYIQRQWITIIITLFHLLWTNLYDDTGVKTGIRLNDDTGEITGIRIPFVVKNRIEDSRFFQILKKWVFPFFRLDIHFEQVGVNWGLTETMNETYRTKTLASPGCPPKISMIYLLQFRRYMRPNK